MVREELVGRPHLAPRIAPAELLGPVLGAGGAVDDHRRQNECADWSFVVDGPGNADHDDLLDVDRFYKAFDPFSGEHAADTRDDCHDWAIAEQAGVDLERSDNGLLEGQSPFERDDLHRHCADEGDAFQHKRPVINTNFAQLLASHEPLLIAV